MRCKIDRTRIFGTHYDREEHSMVATTIDMATQDMIVTLCPITSGLVWVGGIFPADAVKLDP